MTEIVNFWPTLDKTRMKYPHCIKHKWHSNFHDGNCKFSTCCFICITFNPMHTIIFLTPTYSPAITVIPLKKCPTCQKFLESIPQFLETFYCRSTTLFLYINCGTHKQKVCLTHLLFWVGPVPFFGTNGTKIWSLLCRERIIYIYIYTSKEEETY